ncbi:MAG: FAD-dependent oxidoreductase [Myxococcota bacterium]
MLNPSETTTDLIVLGTGAAGLTAALTAHAAGAQVVVLEKAATVGGTTAMSGGVIWVPNSGPMQAAGLNDDRQAAYRYIAQLAEGRSSPELIERFLDAAPAMLDFIEQHTEARFASLTHYPDYHPEFDGGAFGGRSLDNDLFDPKELGDWSDRLRRNPVNGRSPITIREAAQWKVFARPMSIPFKTVIGRAKAGIVHGGAALVGRLLKACLAAGLEPQLETPAQSLLTDEQGRVVGVVAESATHGPMELFARHGVVLATSCLQRQ